MQKLLFCFLAMAFLLSCNKNEACVSHIELTTSTDSYTESDTSKTFAGQKTLNFSLKLAKSVKDNGTCPVDNCSNELTITNLTNKIAVVYFTKGSEIYDVNANSTRKIVVPLGYLSGITNSCMSLQEIKTAITVKYN